MWTLLKDTSEKDMVVFNHLHFADKEKGGDFKNFKINFAEGTPSATYTRHETRASGAKDARQFHIAATDYASFMIAQTCSDENLGEGVDAKWDYVALTRDKAPPKFMRQKMRGIFQGLGVDIPSLKKGDSVKCWGEDMTGK
tara:strand:- start:14 stop:436 length:423 start_codon:yes stop_codon:yes gene_type:complete